MNMVVNVLTVEEEVSQSYRGGIDMEREGMDFCVYCCKYYPETDMGKPDENGNVYFCKYCDNITPVLTDDGIVYKAGDKE